MKKVYLLTLTLILAGGLSLQAQIHIPVKKKATEKTNEEIDKSIDEGLNKLFGKKKKKTKGKDTNANPNAPAQKGEGSKDAGAQTETKDVSNASPTLKWAKYDFVPGDVVIFEDNLEGEENGEFPSRWDLVKGNVEVAEFGGDKVIMFRGGEPSIIPYMDEPQKDYLPEIFTIEFDLYYPGSGSFDVYLYDRKNQKSGSPTGYTDLEIYNNSFSFAQSSSEYPGAAPAPRWMHVSIAYTKGKLKAYMDDTRLINIPRIDFDPKGLTLYTYHAGNDNLFYVKNVRIAKGGVKYYDRFLQDGKIVSNGIRFETGKATLRPESMGVINKIYAMMKDHPDIRLSIEGHTDNVGDAEFNQKLSEERAAAVKDQLVKMGIAADRLTTKGWGETKPVDTNDTPEGRANNRRVEFVKM